MNNAIEGGAGGLHNLQRLNHALTEIDALPEGEQRIHIDEFSRQVNEWSQDGLRTEYRIEASRRILDCFTERTATLNLSQLGLRCLPDCLRHLKELRTLDASGNRLESFPDSMHCLRGLHSLTLCNNRLRELPLDFWKHKIALQELLIQRNRLTSFPVPKGQPFTPWVPGGSQVYGVNLADQPRVYRIELSGNHLTTLAPGIQLLRGLRSLNVSHNELVEIPASIWQLSNLNELNLSYNELAYIPEPMPARLTEHMFRNRGRVTIDATATVRNRSLFRVLPLIEI